MSKVIQIELDDADLQALRHDLVDEEAWLREALAAKTASAANGWCTAGC